MQSDEHLVGSIPISQLGRIMRSLGLNPTDRELQVICNEIDADESGTIDFTEFLDFIAGYTKNFKSEEEIRLAFKSVLDSCSY